MKPTEALAPANGRNVSSAHKTMPTARGGAATPFVVEFRMRCLYQITEAYAVLFLRSQRPGTFMGRGAGAHGRAKSATGLRISREKGIGAIAFAVYRWRLVVNIRTRNLLNHS